MATGLWNKWEPVRVVAVYGLVLLLALACAGTPSAAHAIEGEAMVPDDAAAGTVSGDAGVAEPGAGERMVPEDSPATGEAVAPEAEADNALVALGAEAQGETQAEADIVPETQGEAPKAAKPAIAYRTHVQRVGWQGWKKDGQTSGTSGRSLRLEGINVKLASKPVAGGVAYRTHVQRVGWQGWRKDGAMSGTSDRSLRLEAIQVKLTGQMAKRYDVWYCVHAQHFGWLGWAKNGASAGTEGYAYRLEAIRIVVRRKGAAAPKALGRTKTAFRRTKNKSAHKAYQKVLKSIVQKAKQRGCPVTYCYMDIYGDSTDEFICRSLEGGGSGWTLRVYQYAGNQAKCMLTDGFYGDRMYRFYKTTSAFSQWCAGHGGERYEYYQATNGMYRKVAYQSRRSEIGGGAYTDSWGFALVNANSESYAVGETTFNDYLMTILRGNVAVLYSDSSAWKTA